MPQPVTTTLSDGYLCGASETRNIAFSFSPFILLFTRPLHFWEQTTISMVHCTHSLMKKIEKCNNTLLRSLTIQTGKEQLEKTLRELEIGQPCPLGS